MKLTYFSLLIVLTGLSFSSCKKKGCTDPLADNYSEEAKKDDGTCTFTDKDGTLEIYIDHNWGMSGADFEMNTNLVHPMTGDTLAFTTFKYYISNFQLKDANGDWWTQPESYYLVDLSDGIEEKLTIPNVPFGTYTEMSYVLGVDSARNVAGAQEGALSVANNMFWSWSSGYIMLKAEGNSPQSGSGSFAFHLGGFEGATNVVTTKTALFGSENLEVNENGISAINLIANPARLWHSSPSVEISPMIHAPGDGAVTMATDFYGGVSFDHIDNN
jgi:hypothetical protein